MATAIEYGLIALGISVAGIAVAQGIGPKLWPSAPQTVASPLVEKHIAVQQVRRTACQAVQEWHPTNYSKKLWVEDAGDGKGAFIYCASQSYRRVFPDENGYY